MLGKMIERKIRSGAASEEQELIKTAITFETTALLNAVRQSVSSCVTLMKESMWKSGKKTTLHDSEEGIAWEVGIVSVGDGFRALLQYRHENDVLIGEYCIFEIVTTKAISMHIKSMARLRDEVTNAFKSVDPNVKIKTHQQEMDKSRKLLWF